MSAVKCDYYQNTIETKVNDTVTGVWSINKKLAQQSNPEQFQVPNTD